LATQRFRSIPFFQGLDIPWEITIGPDHDIWTTERSGIVSKINPTTKTREVLLNLSIVIYQQAEAGLLGLALHPDFENTPYVFIVYTYGSFPTVYEKVERYTYENNALVNPVTIIDGILGNSTHNGSRLFFLPDETLLISTGDVQNPNLSQTLSSLNGKILRVTVDGGIPADNPIENSYVYAFGFRNVQGIASSPNGKIYISEHGASNDDEFQLLFENRNYGWPNVEGFCNTASEQVFCANNNVVEPLLVWTPTIAPSDMIFYQNDDFPEFNNKMLMTVLKDKKLLAIEMNTEETEVISETHYLTDVFGRLRDICVGSNNEIYLATSGQSWSNTDPFSHAIIRLTPQSELSTQAMYLDKILYSPNPSNGTIQLLSDQIKSIELISVSGKEHAKINLESGQKQVELPALDSGSYFIKFTLISGEVLTKQHVVNSKS
jgi:aldose sugar dehydrogenase